MHGTGDVTGTDFEERVTGYTSNDLWSGGGTEADLRRFMQRHGVRPYGADDSNPAAIIWR